jgi:exodeoxyribonuclease VII large subunit
VVSRKEDFWAHIDRLGERLAGLVRARLAHLGMRVHELNRRPGMAGWPARLALRGARVTRGVRAHQTLRLQLDTHDQRRRLGGVRGRLVGVDGSLRAAMLQRQHHARAQLQDSSARLESLSPLAVLGRGYAVCWNAARTTVIRDAGTLRPGDYVRVTLHRGELGCDVADISDTEN